MLANKKIIIFDLDGTLIDSVNVWNEVDRRFITALGHSPNGIDVQGERDEKLREYKSADNPYREYCAYVGKKYGSSLSPDELVSLRYKIADELLANEVCYKPYADVFLRKLKSADYTLVIASTTLRSNLNVYRTRNKNIIDTANLDDIFDAIYTREDAKEIKPSPEIHFTIMEKYNVTADECIIFEDSLVGIESANSAGIDVVAIYDENSKKDTVEIKKHSIAYFNNYKEVLEKLKWEY